MRCGKLTTRRRDSRPACLRCWIELTERTQDKEIRKMGKLKGSHGSPL
jgi:hypothetical protein